MLDRRDRMRKRACEECSRSKVRCSGDDPSCTRCIQRSIPCFYPLKRRRGFDASSSSGNEKNQSASASDNESGVGDSHLPSLDLSTLSLFERRCWTVFFTIFRSQQRNRDENPISYCWFATQLNRLSSFFFKKNRHDLVDKLNTWLLASNINPLTLTNSLKFNCNFLPNTCSECSMNAMGMSHGSNVRVKEELFDWKHPLADHSHPSSSSSTSQAKSKIDNHDSVLIQRILGDIDNTSDPYVHLYSNANGESYNVEVNDAFVDEIGFTKEELIQALSWTGSSDGLAGFLPWYGDFFACLLSREVDLLSFLQILAIKYQTAGDLAHHDDDHTKPKVRDLPTSQLFDVRTNYIDTEYTGKGTKNEVVPCLISTVHRERFEHGALHVELFAKIIPINTRGRDPKTRAKMTTSNKANGNGSAQLPLSSSSNFPFASNGNDYGDKTSSNHSVGSQSSYQTDDASTQQDNSIFFDGLFVSTLPDNVDRLQLPPLMRQDYNEAAYSNESVNEDDNEFFSHLLDWAGPYVPPGLADGMANVPKVE